MKDREIVSEEVLGSMGISRAALDEIVSVYGRMPTADELSTLLAMWKMQGGGQGLTSWLRGVPHARELHDYLEDDQEAKTHKVQEPRIGDCVRIARSLFGIQENGTVSASTRGELAGNGFGRGKELYMVGDVAPQFVDSEYGRRYLHIAEHPVATGNREETSEYIELILSSMCENGMVDGHAEVGAGGLFGCLLGVVGGSRYGFDILCCREVRLDSFLFGEGGVRQVAWFPEAGEDYFVEKITQAGLNCCFLGRSTKGRIMVDGMDFGNAGEYAAI